MPDPDPTARELMDAPGTRVTPEPDEHPRGATAGFVPAARPGAHGHTPDRPGGREDTGLDGRGPDDLAPTEGGTGTSGSRGGGPAADFRDAADRDG